MMETFSLSPAPTLIVPEHRPFDQAAAPGTGRHPGTGPGVGDGERPPQSPPVVGTLLHRRWQRFLAWGGLGLLVSGVWGVSWLSRQPPRVPPVPPTHSALAVSVLPGAAVPVAHLPVQRQPPAGTTPGLPLQRPPALLAQSAAPRRSKAVVSTQTVRVGPPQHARKRHAPLRLRMVARAPARGMSRPGALSAPLPAPQPFSQWSAPTPAPQGERPWHWHGLPATGDG